MFSTEDTIVAIATPPGRGGIGVVRISGPAARDVAGRILTHRAALEPRHATFTFARALGDGHAAGAAVKIDQVVVTFFPEPASYTGEDVVELSAHGSPIVLHAIVTSAVAAGARLAEPGEFTLRAFLNGRLDLPQAEAVADLIDAVTPLQARAAFDQLLGTVAMAIGDVEQALFDLIARLEASIDFPDEGYHFIDPPALDAELERIRARITALLHRGQRGRLIRDGRIVAIVGAPNVGKSSLFNALVGSARAIVTATPGTTRDLISETVDLDGHKVTLVDTAGLRETDDEIEVEGMTRTRGAAAVADVVLIVYDGGAADGRTSLSNPLGAREDGQHEASTVVSVTNKADLSPFVIVPGSIPVSAATGAGLDELRKAITVTGADATYSVECPELSNIRHLTLLERAGEALDAAIVGVRNSTGALPEEFVLSDLQRARAALEEVSGRRSSEDLLVHIFQRFCIGK